MKPRSRAQRVRLRPRCCKGEKKKEKEKEKIEAKVDLKFRVSNTVRVRRKKKLRDSETLRHELEVRL